MNYPVGMLAMFPEEKPCFCGDDLHYHAIECVWNGKEFLPVNSQAGIEFIAHLKKVGEPLKWGHT